MLMLMPKPKPMLRPKPKPMPMPMLKPKPMPMPMLRLKKPLRKKAQKRKNKVTSRRTRSGAPFPLIRALDFRKKTVYQGVRKGQIGQTLVEYFDNGM